MDSTARHSNLHPEGSTVASAVEIKSFIGPSPTADLEQAMGQFTVYRTVLARTDPDRVLYLAVRKKTLRDVFGKPLGKLLLESHLVHEEVIVQWID